MDAVLVVGLTVAVACVVCALYYAGYRAGWGVGYDVAYNAMVRDLRKGEELFGESGLAQWQIPENWLKQSC